MKKTFSSYVNELFFGIFTYEATPSVVAFLKRYVPAMAEKPKPSKGGWAAYPPGFFKEPKHQIVNNAYIFRQHPSIKGVRVGGKLSITCKVYFHSTFTNVQDIRLCLTFNKENKGKEVFDKIVQELTRLKASITEKKVNDLPCVVAKSDTHPFMFMPRDIQVIFGKDNFRPGMFNIVICVGDQFWPEIISMPI